MMTAATSKSNVPIIFVLTSNAPVLCCQNFILTITFTKNIQTDEKPTIKQ